MGNIIHTIVYDTVGNVYTNNVFVKHFVHDKNMLNEKIIIFLRFYKSVYHYLNGYSYFIPLKNENDIDDKILFFSKNLSHEELLSINEVTIQSFVTEYLKSIYGEDKVEEIYNL